LTAKQAITGLVIDQIYDFVIQTQGKFNVKIGTDDEGDQYGSAITPTSEKFTRISFTATSVEAHITIDNTPASLMSIGYVGKCSVGGSFTLTATADIFDTGHVGTLFYIEPEDLSTIKPWTPGEEFEPATPPLNEKRRSAGNTYICPTTGTITAGKVWRTGPDKPTHTFGTQADGGGGGLAVVWGAVGETTASVLSSAPSDSSTSSSITGASSTLTVSSPINLTSGTVNLAADNNLSVTAAIATTNATSSASAALI
jgi:hypothetical protein